LTIQKLRWIRRKWRKWIWTAWSNWNPNMKCNVVEIVRFAWATFDRKRWKICRTTVGRLMELNGFYWMYKWVDVFWVYTPWSGSQDNSFKSLDSRMTSWEEQCCLSGFKFTCEVREVFYPPGSVIFPYVLNEEMPIKLLLIDCNCFRRKTEAFYLILSKKLV